MNETFHEDKTPSESKTLCSDEENYAIVTEGEASVLFPKGNNVFYNPVQEFNRDLTIAVISTFIRKWLNEEREQDPSDNLGRMRKRKIRILNKNNNQNNVNSDEALKNGPFKGVQILEGLAATGLRSVRFSLEIPKFVPPYGLRHVVANDVDSAASDVMRKNIKRNQTSDVMSVSCDDVNMLMLKRAQQARKAKKTKTGDGGVERKQLIKSDDGETATMDTSDSDLSISDDLFQVIDLDPYGTAAPFLDAAVQAIEDGGLLCITCTDAAVLCGQTPETCFTKYGSVSLRAKFCHEQAVRIVLHCLNLHAARHSKFVQPLISLSIDFYIRVFVRVHVGQAQAKLSYTKTAMVYNCSGCGTHQLQPMGQVERNGNSVKFLSSPVIGGISEKCIHCRHRVHIGGPVWSDPIHDLGFVACVKELVDAADTPDLKTRDRIVGMLTLVEEELPNVPLYYVLDEGICGALHCFVPPALKFRSAFLNAGFSVSLSHAAESSLKTDAPPGFVWDVMRAWVKESPINEKRMVEGSVAHEILSVEPEAEIDFTPHKNAITPSQVQGLKRFPLNPESHWGPKPRAKKREANPNSESEPVTHLSVKKTKTKETKYLDLKKFRCKHFLAGKCDRGDDCVYNHSI